MVQKEVSVNLNTATSIDKVKGAEIGQEEKN